jgi:hypothetical protein
MKIVKLNGRYKLHRDGFTVALRFKNRREFYQTNVYSILYEMYGDKAWYNPSGVLCGNERGWAMYQGAGSGSGRVCWVGLRNEVDITMILLRASVPQ